MRRNLNLLLFVFLSVPSLAADEPEELTFTVSVDRPVKAAVGKYWMQVRAGIVPAGEPGAPKDRPRVVMALQLEDAVGTHMYHGVQTMWTDDLGETWQGPKRHDTLARRAHENGLIEVPCDTTPMWHAKTRKLLLTGATFWLDPKLKRDVRPGPSDAPYSVYDPVRDVWTNWRTIDFPDLPRFGWARAGNSQRVDLPGGEVLLPIYVRKPDGRFNRTTIARCRFDGQTLEYVEHGDELVVEFGRGFVEPSLVRFGERFYLTLRNDERGYVAESSDGLHFSTPIEWKFDDDKPIGSYNTQAHWVAHSDGLFLAYTRRGADNDRVFRHRAPVFVARVDTKSLRVIRSTEKAVLPNERNGFGNFGVTHVTPMQTWITAGRRGAKAGEPSVYVAKMRWTRPNRLLNRD